MKPGPRNLITDVDGIRVGNAQDDAARTGVTVVLPDERTMAGVDVRGAAPGTRETDLLNPSCRMDGVDAICLSGGSAFGLAAADGVAQWLHARGRGFPVAGWHVPIVPAAIIFDLTSGDKNWGDTPPYRALAAAACDDADTVFSLGNCGAGLGAHAGRLKGGLGSVSMVAEDGLQVGALVVANPVGAVTMPGSGTFWAWALEQEGELGHQRPPRRSDSADQALPSDSRLGANTTLAVVATNARLDKAQAQRVAMMAHDGMARAIRPVHTPFDGDTIFALSTGRIGERVADAMTVARVGAMAADCVARATARGVFAAESLGDSPGYRQVHADAFTGSP